MSGDLKQNSEAQMPTLGEMTKNIVTSAAEAIEHYRHTKIFIAQERERQRRLNVCKSCEFIVLDDMRCTKCGCFMMVKTGVAASKCPINKW